MGDGKEVRARKKFKMPKVELKAPKVPDFIRSLSKERKKNKDKAVEQEGDEEKGEEEAAEKDAEDGEEAPKDTKTKVKEAIENIHMPKLPKIHKPAFLKKKKATEEDGEEAAADDKDKEKNEDAAEENEEKEEKKEGEGEEEEEKEKKSSKIIDSLKDIKSKVHVPAFLSKKTSSKEKDVEAGDKEESKEL